MHLVFITGTRPEIIKTAPVIKAARCQRIRISVIHTGQHHAPEMSEAYYRQFRLKRPDVILKPGTREGRAAFLRKTQSKAIWHLRRMKPDLVLVQGDTDSVVAGALAARECGIPVGHIEAGLRSFDRHSIEEKNRIKVDRMASMLFCPTAAALANLEKEREVRGRVFLTGNPVADIYKQYRPGINAAPILHLLGLKRKRFMLLTIHRQETTARAGILSVIFQAISAAGVPVIFPVHPRTLQVMESSDLLGKLPVNMELLSPLPYIEFMGLAKYARLVLTDSGGVQEEACLLRTPCVTLREYTERPETMALGVNRLTGYSEKDIREAIIREFRKERLVPHYRSPYGPGDAAEKIISAVKSSISM